MLIVAILIGNIIAMRKEFSVSVFTPAPSSLPVFTIRPMRSDADFVPLPGLRRKEHLTKLEHAQREQSSAQNEEVERLRRENLALSQENKSLRSAYRSNASSPAPNISPVDLRGSPSSFLPYGPPGAFLEAVTASNLSSAPSLSSGVVTPAPSTGADPANLVVVVPNNIREIRRALHRLFAPILEIPVISNPQNHLITLAALAPSLPACLKPTELQLITPHHAYIDMIPSPMLRDRLIHLGPASSNTFMMQVCTIACDIEDTGQMTVWGEDWLNEFSWEFASPVLEHWGGWLLTSEWGRRANFWRRQRGAPILPGYD